MHTQSISITWATPERDVALAVQVPFRHLLHLEKCFRSQMLSKYQQRISYPRNCYLAVQIHVRRYPLIKGQKIARTAA